MEKNYPCQFDGRNTDQTAGIDHYGEIPTLEILCSSTFSSTGKLWKLHINIATLQLLWHKIPAKNAILY